MEVRGRVVDEGKLKERLSMIGRYQNEGNGGYGGYDGCYGPLFWLDFGKKVLIRPMSISECLVRSSIK